MGTYVDKLKQEKADAVKKTGIIESLSKGQELDLKRQIIENDYVSVDEAKPVLDLPSLLKLQNIASANSNARFDSLSLDDLTQNTDKKIIIQKDNIRFINKEYLGELVVSGTLALKDGPDYSKAIEELNKSGNTSDKEVGKAGTGYIETLFNRAGNSSSLKR